MKQTLLARRVAIQEIETVEEQRAFEGEATNEIRKAGDMAFPKSEPLRLKSLYPTESLGPGAFSGSVLLPVPYVLLIYFSFVYSMCPLPTCSRSPPGFTRTDLSAY